MSPLDLAVLALAGLCALFALLWLVCRRADNYGFVDAAWAYAFAAVAGFYAWYGPGWFLRRFAIAAMVVLWSVRLGTHLLRRLAAHHPVEDGRYVRLRQDWAGNFGPKMAGFFQLQAASVVLLAVVLLPPVFNPTPRFHLLEMIGAALWFVALYGESVADAQLAAFKRRPENRGRVCDVGLWRLSRHPNYFCEWLVWVAYFLFALASPWGWVAAVAPTCILYLLLRVTGVPLAEEQALRSKGEAYRRYQATTSAFVPWFPRGKSTAPAR
jgi:steroid 5-alpha reductase family enzyme